MLLLIQMVLGVLAIFYYILCLCGTIHPTGGIALAAMLLAFLSWYLNLSLIFPRRGRFGDKYVIGGLIVMGALVSLKGSEPDTERIFLYTITAMHALSFFCTVAISCACATTKQ